MRFENLDDRHARLLDRLTVNLLTLIPSKDEIGLREDAPRRVIGDHTFNVTIPVNGTHTAEMTVLLDLAGDNAWLFFELSYHDETQLYQGQQGYMLRIEP